MNIEYSKGPMAVSMFVRDGETLTAATGQSAFNAWITFQCGDETIAIYVPLNLLPKIHAVAEILNVPDPMELAALALGMEAP